MLERIREGSQGLTAKIVLGVVILSFALAGISGYLGSATDQSVAEVNGVKISRTEFSRAYQNETSRLEQQFGEYFAQLSADPAYMAQIRQSVINRLVEQELQSQLAASLGMRISDEELKSSIRDMPYFQVGNQFSNDRYLQVIRQLNFQPDDFRDYMRSEMTRSQLVSSLAGSDFTLPNELADTMKLQNQTRTIDFLTIKLAGFSDQVEISEQEIADYFDINRAQFMAPEKVALDYIELNAADLPLLKPVSDEDVLASYESNKAQYMEPEQRRVSHILVNADEDDAAAKAKAEALLAKLKAGEDFAALAESDSDDVVSAEQGGDLDWIERDMMDPEFEKAAFALSNKGDVSSVVKSEFGYHIIKLTDLKPEEVKAFDEVKDELRAELEKNARIEQFYEKQTKLAELAFEIADSLNEAAAAVGVSVKHSELASQSELPAPLNNSAVTAAVFTPELIQDRVNSEVIEVGNEHVVVVRVSDHKAAATKPLEEVSAQIKATLVDQKASELAKEKAQALYAAMETGKSLETIAQEEGLEIQHEEALARRAYSVAPAITQAVFKLPHPVDGPVSKLVELSNGDAALVSLSKVNDAPESEANPQLKQSLTMAQVNKNYLVFVDALKAQADIKTAKVSAEQE